jgi:hypothetical protein
VNGELYRHRRMPPEPVPSYYGADWPAPEPWASFYDYVSAGQSQEAAIHADTSAELTRALRASADQLQHAHDYWVSAGRNDLAARTAEVRDQILSWADAVPGMDPDQLRQLRQTLYRYQGVIGSLTGAAADLLPVQRKVAWLLTLAIALAALAAGIALYLLLRRR